MSAKQTMDELTKGTWIINSQKQLQGIREDVPDRYELDATDMAGKAGCLLARLASDSTETISMEKVSAFSQSIGIGKNPTKIKPYLDMLKTANKIDYTAEEVEVYCFSTQDAIKSTSQIFDSLGATKNEEANLISLDSTFHLPYTQPDLIRVLTEAGINEEDAHLTLALQENLGLVKTSGSSGKLIYYNEYAFAGKSEKIVAAMQALKPAQQQVISEIREIIDTNPGYPLDELRKNFPENILELMEGIGLFDGVTVESQNHQAIFVCSPQLKGMSITDTDAVSADVFHKAKILLSCLRFGQFKSRYGRGKISDPQMMLNIVNKLNRGEWVGPCSAIGHDYKELEVRGTIETRLVKFDAWGRFEMRLRQKDVGALVHEMLVYKRVLQPNSESFDDLLGEEPVLNCQIPEKRRRDVIANMTAPMKSIRDQMIDSIRTGLDRR